MSSLQRLAFLDLETTGLDPARHDLWEIGLILRNTEGADDEFHWQIWPDMAKADPTGLRISRFYERIQVGPPDHAQRIHRTGHTTPVDPEKIAEFVASQLDGRHIVGAVPNFDDQFLAAWLRRNGQAPTWHYHLIDVETLAAGWLAGRASRLEQYPGLALPWDSQALGEAVGVPPQSETDRHTALGDARWARNVYDAVHGEYQSPPSIWAGNLDPADQTAETLAASADPF